MSVVISNLPHFVRDLLASPPRRGEGLNLYLFRTARVLPPYRSADEIECLLEAVTAGEAIKPGEIERAVKRSAACAWKPGQRAMVTRAPAWPRVNTEQREAVTATGIGLADLWELSPVRFADNESHTEEIIDQLFPRNPLLCVGKKNSQFATQYREKWRGRLKDMALIVPSPMSAQTGRTQDGRKSEHTLENTGPRRFLVIEQDRGSEDEQAAILLHLAERGPLVLAVHSARKSVHGWFYCKNQPEERLRDFMQYAVSLGADRATWTRSQFVRLPDSTRANTAIGSTAMFSNQSGSNNTAIGQTALYSNTNGGGNTATGTGAMYSNTNGISNTATGFEALYRNTEGQYNTATGNGALAQNSTGNFNTGSGASALVLNTTGANNTALGVAALASNTTGNNNIALGFEAGINLTTGNFNIDIGNAGVAGESRRIRIGTTGTHTRTFIAGISGATVPSGVGVIVGSNGQLGTVVSSARFKQDIKPMDKASEALHALKPVTFRYKQELDPDGIPQFGLVAEDVEKVNSDLVARDEQGKPYTVRYEAVNAMLLNEFLKEHKAFVAEQRKVQEQGATIARLEQQIDALAIGLQKVSDQLEVNKTASQIVLNNQ